MVVLLPNATATVRRALDDYQDAYGGRVAAGWDDPGEMYDARVAEKSDGTWALGVDTALWPIRKGDLIVTGDDQEFLVQTAQPNRNNYDPSVDWVRVTALQRTTGGTEPGGAGMVGRD